MIASPVRIDGELWVPDPASRWQPEGVHGPSVVVDPAAHEWKEPGWTGRPWEEAVVYELHTGTFTEAGSFDGIAAKLDHLADLGVTALELMPVAHFGGRRGWGYDGVLPYAPHTAYGGPEALKRLNGIVHPLVGEDRKAFFRKAEAEGAEMVVLDIPLLFETGGERLCDAVALVTAPAFLQSQRDQTLPLFFVGWLEDIHDPHNWYAPYLTQTYARRQSLPEDLRAQYQELLSEAVVELDPEARHAMYQQVNQMQYDNPSGILLATPTTRRYEQRWVEGYFFNPIYSGLNFYILSKN